ncbi:patatin-like phospholipase family protein [Flavobacterium cellulosilyticum]|uniref:Patatin n=1 Tax=Flavobacterium cellulosilyticum TaxID=2541731 RepID=A0A4R5CN55_9FLAO|nr:patatin-like phospholipase family protein [Flavobacterium cellulosilyticum]TDD99813.1 patatin [Flavobacterium cellulosilyticum]
MRNKAKAKSQELEAKINFVNIQLTIVNSRLLLILTFLLFFAFCLLPLASQAQDTIKKRPKIGLVLSGGGAKGFAHIGVLKVIEQAGIKIDYIGGTSMGSVVGGLYASGYNATQIDSIFRTVNFDKLLQDFTPRSSKSFYEKRNDELYAIVLPFDKFKIGVPEALSKSIYNYNLLTSLTRNDRHISDFNKLKIPFFCVATNIENGEEVILDKGNLVNAMVASSAFPSLFSPVEIDGNLLLDGGIVNNYPVEKVRQMGADIIIGVDVQDGLSERSELKKATRIIGQITAIQSIEKMKKKIAETDIYIKPDIKSYGIISFDKGLEIIKKGEEAAFAVYEQLNKIGDKNSYIQNKLKPSVDSIYLNKIIINDLNNYTPLYIKGKLPFKEGKNISYQDLRKGIDNLNATNNFSGINYSFEENNSRDDLILNLTENYDNTFLKFGLHFDNLFKSGVLVNLTQKKTLFKNDVASVDVVLGDNFRYNIDYYIDNGFYWSYGFKSYFNQFNKNVSKELNDENYWNSNLNNINLDFSDLTNQVYLQTLFARKFLIGAGVEVKFLKIQSETLSNTSPIIDKSSYTSVYGYLKYDSLDNKYFPKKGLFFSGDIQSYLFSSDYSTLFKPFSIAKANCGAAISITKNFTLNIQTEGGFSLGGESVPFFDFVLGGYGFNPVNNFRPFYGYDFISLAANSYLKGSLCIDYEIFKKHHLNFSANYANIEKDLFQTLHWISLPKYSGYAIGYGLDSIIGPIEIKHSWSPETSKNYTWFSVGFWF